MGIDLNGTDVSGFHGGKGDYGSLSMDGHMLQLAQWPNIGYNHIGEILEEGPVSRFLKPGDSLPSFSFKEPSGGKFSTQENIPASIIREFRQTQDVQVQGYLSNDWFFQSETIGQIDDKGIIQLLKHTRYGVKNKIKSVPRRIRLVNVLAELDQPGEWYYDYKYKGLYVWPIKGFDKASSRVIVPDGDALVSMTNTKHLTFRGVTIENTDDLALEVRNGNYTLIADSIIRNGNKKGINITGGKYNGISGCLFHNLYTAFHIRGGNMKTLDRCYNFATNNRIHSCRLKGYGVISLSGVGIRFAHNLLHDMNGAVKFESVDLLMEYNEFYNIGYEMGDFNVAYCGAQWWTLGNVLRYNFVHHLIEPGGHPVSPFRNDDGGAGLNIFGNVFYRTGRCAAIFAGPANTIENNIALDMSTFWWTNKRPVSKKEIAQEWEQLDRFGEILPKGDKGDYLYIAERKVGPKFWEKSPWKEQYPEFEEFLKINPWAQTFGRVDRNYAYNIKNLFHIHGGDGTVQGMESKRRGTFKDLPKQGVFRFPESIELRKFENPETLNFALKSSFKPMKNFVDIPFEMIGLRKSPFRSKVPDKDVYRRAQYEKFKDDRKTPYDAKRVNARYPIPAYLQ